VPSLDEVRGFVEALLNCITLKQLVESGVAAYSSNQLQELAADDAGVVDDAAAADMAVDVYVLLRSNSRCS
jgi:hypothetical protein